MATARGTKPVHVIRRSSKRITVGTLKVQVHTAGVTIPRSFKLFEALIDEHGKVVVDRVADSFGMSKLQIVQTAGISHTAMYKPKRLQSPKAQVRMREMLEIVSRVSDWAGGTTQGMAWYRAEPIPAFGGRTAEALVKQGKATAVRDYLDTLALGGFA